MFTLSLGYQAICKHMMYIWEHLLSKMWVKNKPWNNNNNKKKAPSSLSQAKIS